MGGLKATTKWVFIGHFVVRPPCEKVQGPLQLWQARHFVEKLLSNEGCKIEIRLKKGLGNPRHFVVKLPGPMADSSRLEPLHFVVNALGFWKHVACCDFAKVFHLYIIQFLKYRQTQVSSICQVFVSLSHSLLALLCVASVCFKRACLIICCIAPPTHPYKIFCQNIYNMDWCVVVYLPKKDRSNF